MKCPKKLKQQIVYAKETLGATKGCVGSGTVACRLWHELDSLCREIKESKGE